MSDDNTVQSAMIVSACETLTLPAFQEFAGVSTRTSVNKALNGINATLSTPVRGTNFVAGRQIVLGVEGSADLKALMDAQKEMEGRSE